MRKSRFTDSQILAFLKLNEEGTTVPDLCRKHGFSSAQFYKCKRQEKNPLLNNRCMNHDPYSTI